MKPCILILLALTTAIPAFCREITGKVFGEKDAPLSFVNVVLYRDSAYLTGTVTDERGRFSIHTDVNGNLNARISLVGYDTYSSEVPATGDMGIIRLAPSAVSLEEVEVRAARPSTILKGNALVTNVEGSSLAIAGTAKDVLVEVPMVIDNVGSLEVFGKGSPEIYINRRKVNDLQELSQLSSGDIKNVEVITNPGSAYAANVKSVIRIRTKQPKGEGFRGTLRADNGFQHYFRTGNSLDLKYRTGGLEIFVNYGWWRGDTRFDRLNDMNTTTSRGTYRQYVSTTGKESYNDMTGKLGFSYMINNKHSIGAYYQNSWNRHRTAGTIPSEIWQDDTLLDRYNSNVQNQSSAVPRHNANLYYNGVIGKLNIDFNSDYLWYKNREVTFNNEFSEMGDNRDVNTSSVSRNRMFAEKLVLTYPIWKGEIEIGQEYTNTRSTNLFVGNIEETPDADNRVDESNIAVFAELGQQFGRFMIGLGLRYENVRFNYYNMGLLQDGQSKIYNNIFPSVNIATQVGNVRMGLNYTGKTMRPGYSQLEGTISYINRLTYETGNPYLKPTKLQTVEYIAQWSRFFAQLSYTFFKDGVYHITEPYGLDGEAIIIRTANLNHRHYLQVFAGVNSQVGIWQPKVNVGMMKQWLALPVNGVSMNMNTPIFMFQWQNAVHLPFDIWLNVDAQLMTRGWDNNTRLTNTPWYVNAKVYKGFFNDAFSVMIETKDLFDTARNNFYLCSDAVQIRQKNYSSGRSVMLTLQYRFNATRDRYRGTGAGNTEKSRL
ncbi:MAG: TonB-dependent receptor [Muribaculaceae bacterium]|nr:TonB-dependent receptor [Muribaculaceae bacterium]